MYYRKVQKCPWIDEQDVKVSMSRRQCPLILLFSSWIHRLTLSILNGKEKRKDIWSSCTRPSTFDLSYILVCFTGWQALLWYGSVTYSEINTLASEGASFSSDVVDSARLRSEVKWCGWLGRLRSEVKWCGWLGRLRSEVKQRRGRSVLGWVTRRHVPFSGSGGTLGIRVTGLLVILCGWSGVEGLDRQLACKQGCPAV